MLRQLPLRERLKVIAQVVSESERELPSEPAARPKKSLYGMLADQGPAPSAEEIDEARREAWANFPRDDI
jgi:hypothetical protein